MTVCTPDAALRAFAAAAPDLIDEILDQIAATPDGGHDREPVQSLTEVAGVLLDMRAGRTPSGSAVRVVYSDETQIEGLFRSESWTPPRPPARPAAPAA